MQPEPTETTTESSPASKEGPKPQSSNATGTLTTFLPLILLFVVFYFLLIRPQQKRQRETETMLKSLRRGDKVRTSGGIRGEIVDIKDNEVDLVIADKVKINVLLSHISGKEQKQSTTNGKS